jgi:hypothetical protein
MEFFRGFFRKTIIFFPGFETEQGDGGSPGGIVHRGRRCSGARGAQGRGGKRRGRRGGHTELLTSVGRRRRRLVDVVQGRPAAVQGDSCAPAAGNRQKRVELGQLGVLELVAGSAAPIGLHAGVSTSAAAAGSEWPAAQSGRGTSGEMQAHARAQGRGARAK